MTRVWGWVVAAVTGVFFAVGWAAGRCLYLVVYAGCAIADGYGPGRRPPKRDAQAG